MKTYYIMLLVFLVNTVHGQFRNTTWNMSVADVSRVEEVSVNKATYGELEKGTNHFGFKGHYEIGDTTDQIYNNFVFIKDELKSGRFVFYALEDFKIDEIIEHVVKDFGQYQYSYGNAKLIRLTDAPDDRQLDFKYYLRRGYSVQITWQGDQESTVVFRIVNTNSNLFGVWGWLTYYQNDYYLKHVEPGIQRSTSEPTFTALGGG